MTRHPADSRHWPLDHVAPFRAIGSEDIDRVCDLSAVPRFGLRGPGTAAWLTSRGYCLPAAVNRVEEAAGVRIARLGQDEALILPADPLDASWLADLRQAWDSADVAKGHDAYRDEGWCWLRMSGPGIEDALGVLTAADTRAAAFPAGGVLQTLAMHLDAVLLRAASGVTVDMFFDVTSSEYAMAFFGQALPDHRFGRVMMPGEAAGLPHPAGH